MSQLQVLITRLDKELPLPNYAKGGDAGADIYSRIDITLAPGERALIPTGISIALPDGYVALVHPRSGLAIKHGVTMVNAPGTVDAAFRGELQCIMINHDPKEAITFKRGDRIAQLVFQKVEHANFVEVEDLPGSGRGDGGFGSTGESMTTNSDRDKVLAAFGGKKGLIDSGIPSILFLIVFNVQNDLHQALYASVAISILLTIIRLAKRDTVQHAFSGLIGALICAWFANRTGNPSDVFVPKMLTNLAYGTVYLIANLAGWPILGLFLGPILGENLLWRNDPVRKAAYLRAGWLWVGLFFTRIAVQYPIYKSGNVNLLGTVNLAMGYPLFIATGYGTWLILRNVPVTKQP